MIRVLHIFHEMSNGGNCHFVMNYYRKMDRSRIQFDFLTSVSRKGYFDDEIERLGGKIYHAYPLTQNPIRNYQSITQIVRENNYQIVHRHTGNAFGYYELRAAKKGGAQHLILHSHNTKAEHPALHKFSNKFLKIECEHFACSKEAGQFLFGKSGTFTVINNAIDCDKFAYSEKKREKKRKELNIQDKFVIGHIGRFGEQKNHTRLLDIFNSFLKEEPNAILVCVGEGFLLNTIKEKASHLEIEDKILFLGERTDISDLLAAFDIFLFPSLYEGLGISAVEAQNSGLFCIASDHVPAETNLTGLMSFVPLDADCTEWVQAINNCRNNAVDRSAYANRVRIAGYDLTENAKLLEDYYEHAYDTIQ